MKEGMQIEFQKWEGTGNTFVMVDDRKGLIKELENEVIQRICDEEETDGIIFIKPAVSPEADLLCDFRNPDGSRSFCGNGTRATFAYARREGWLKDQAVLEACDGLHRVKWNAEFDLPSVEFESIDIPVQAGDDWFVHTGSPHHVFRVDSPETLELVDIEKIGAEIRYSDQYKPQGTNVSGLCNTKTPGTIHLRTYERGVEAETDACGTGAVAAALIDHTINGGSPERKVQMPGGDLHVEFEPVSNGYKSVWLSGKASEMRRGIITFLLALLPFFTQAQTPWYDSLSDQTEVSVLTASPGSYVYALFGHSALRIHDPLNLPQSDWVFNYGTFSFTDGFYLKFVKGRLDYKLTVEPYHHFYKVYQDSGRGLTSLSLDLTPEQVKSVAKYLAWNAQPENATYSYEFFRDNCATRILTVLEESLGDSFEPNCVPDGSTFRDGLKPYITCSPWTEFGMDFILGPEADKVMEGCGASYIPYELELALIYMNVDDRSLVTKREPLIISSSSWMNPDPPKTWGLNSVELVLLLLSITLFFLKFILGTSNFVTNITVKTVHVVAASLGLLLLAMWLFTDHVDTWANWNLVWTIPALVTLIDRKREAVYSCIVAVYLLLAPFVWPQCITLSLWLVAMSVFLTITPKLK
ncbi:MAG: diaminopimelate epimerase [Euryarchaeota archaeon]|nr:diaminopimelate epimerase [Euryarchaeota archaeon]|tara:strand:- start:1752 stop:3668 length:1917 start_codon:yes stop_codon:yes gene_type:complete